MTLPRFRARRNLGPWSLVGRRLRIALACWLVVFCAATTAVAQSFPSNAPPRVQLSAYTFPAADPAPRMMEPSEEIGHPLPRRRYLDPRYRGRGYELTDLESRRWAQRTPSSRVMSRSSAADLPTPAPAGQPYMQSRPKVIMSAPAEGGRYGTQYPAAGPPTNAPFVDGYTSEGPYVEGPPDGYMGDGYEGGPYGEYGPWEGDCGGCGHCEQCCGRARLCDSICDWCWSPEGACAIGRNLSAIGSVQAFKGPVDLGVNGNFGVYYGGNWGFPFLRSLGIGGQAGAIVSFADFQGGSGIVNQARTQWFVTGGFFHRAVCDEGLQGGAVLDYLNDEFYVTMNLLQIRGEIGYIWHQHEIGFWTAVHTKSDSAAAPSTFGVPQVIWQANDQFNLYYRFHYGFNTVGRMWIGLDEDADVLFGGDFTAPLNEQWALLLAYNYMIPRDNSDIPNTIKETWGITLGTVWYPRCKTPNCRFDPFRPLFGVADNSTFFVTTKQQ